jgi:hypothetical protein
VRFRAGELEFNATVAESSQSRSLQTGDVLRSLTIRFRAQKAGLHEAAVAEALARQSGGLYSFAEAGLPELEWCVRESNWTYVGSEPWGVNHHMWRIEQVERLRCTRLAVGRVVVEPYEYVERASDDGVIMLAARALVSEADLAALSRIRGQIEVTRHGISDVPRQMRLDYVWGERPDGLAVVVRCEDVREPRLTLAGFEPPPADFEQLLELISIDEEAFTLRRHNSRRVAHPDAWAL